MLATLWSSVPLFAQDIELPGAKMTLQQFFNLVEKQSDYSFAYNEGVLDLEAKVSSKGGIFSLEQALDAVLSQVDARYTLKGKQILITKNEKPVRKYSGRVFDETHQILPGAVVMCEDASIAAVCDSDGRYSIECPEGTLLQVYFTGYELQKFHTSSRTQIDVFLNLDKNILEDAVIIGYGAVKRKDITTAVSVVSTQDVENRPLISAASILQGKAAGVQVVQPSGMPGTALSVRVRGATSVQGGVS